MSLSRTVKNILRGVLVLSAVVLITSFSVDATDTFRTSQSALGIFARYATAPSCPLGTVPLAGTEPALCIDVYENSVAETCVMAEPRSDSDTAANINDANCTPVSVSGKNPWRFVSKVQAVQLCARAHKRLPTALEWFTAALGTPDGEVNCSLAGSLRATGEKNQCKSGVGAFDMIGNVWEFVSNEVQDGKVDAAVVPAEGYVSEIRNDGLPSITTRVATPMYNNDYFWSEATGTYAIMRGGFYGSGSDGGLYSTHAAVTQSFSSAAAGFRCVTVLAR